LIEHGSDELPVTMQAELLSLNRSHLYYQPRPPSAAEVALKHRIDELYTQWPFDGSRRIPAQVQQEAVEVHRKAVHRQMREVGIEGVSPRPNGSKRTQQEGIYPYLLRHITSAYPTHMWGIDITFIRLHAGWMYLVAILDGYSRSVVSWELDQTLEMSFVLTATQRVLAQATPQICHSDQGSHLSSPHYSQLLLSQDVHISMDSKGRALDNIFTERLWRTSKYEEIYLHDSASPKEAGQQLRDSLQFYHHQRLHQALDYRAPAEVYLGR
jgi:putative transposase